MKTRVLAGLFLFPACASVPASSSRTSSAAAAQSEARSTVSTLGIHLGVRALDEGDWDLLDRQGMVGLEFVREDSEDLVGFEVGLFVSGDGADDVVIGGNTFDLEARTGEIAVGVRKTLGLEYPGLHPYVGGGLSLLRAEMESKSGSSTTKDDDDSPGLYVHTGLAWDVSRSLSLGLDLRLRSGREVEIFGGDRSADYAQLALVLGVGL